MPKFEVVVFRKPPLITVPVNCENSWEHPAVTLVLEPYPSDTTAGNPNGGARKLPLYTVGAEYSFPPEAERAHFGVGGNPTPKRPRHAPPRPSRPPPPPVPPPPP